MLGGLFGVTSDQTVVVNVANVANVANLQSRDQKLLPPDPCMVQLKLFGADGSVVAQTGFLKIMPGAAVSQQFKFDQLLTTDSKVFDFASIGGNRMPVRVASYVIGGDSAITDGTSQKVTTCPASQFKYLKLSTEVFDNATGRTTFLVPADSALPAVQ